MSSTRYATWCRPGPRLARNFPTAVSGPSGCSSSMWPSPTSSSAASTPCSATVSRCTSGIPSRSRYTASEASMSSTAMPTWSIVDSTRREDTERPLGGSARPGRRGRVLGRRGRDADLAAADPPWRRLRDAGHDPLDVLTLEHLVAEQRCRELVELDAMIVDDGGRGAKRFVGELADLLVGDAPGRL